MRVPLLTTPLDLPLRLTDDWQMIALGEQHYCACEFGIKTAVLLVRSQYVRQTELVECGLNGLVRQQYRYEFLCMWCMPLRIMSVVGTSKTKPARFPLYRSIIAQVGGKYLYMIRGLGLHSSALDAEFAFLQDNVFLSQIADIGDGKP